MPITQDRLNSILTAAQQMREHASTLNDWILGAWHEVNALPYGTDLAAAQAIIGKLATSVIRAPLPTSAEIAIALETQAFKTTSSRHRSRQGLAVTKEARMAARGEPQANTMAETLARLEAIRHASEAVAEVAVEVEGHGVAEINI